MNILEQITFEADVINSKRNYDLALKGIAHSTIEEYGDISKSWLLRMCWGILLIWFMAVLKVIVALQF